MKKRLNQKKSNFNKYYIACLKYILRILKQYRALLTLVAVQSTKPHFEKYNRFKLGYIKLAKQLLINQQRCKFVLHRLKLTLKGLIKSTNSLLTDTTIQSKDDHITSSITQYVNRFRTVNVGLRKKATDYNRYFLTMRRKKNNTFFSVHYCTGKLLKSFSIGQTGFKGPKKTTFLALENLVKLVGTYLRRNRIRQIVFFITTKPTPKVQKLIRILTSAHRDLKVLKIKTVKYTHSKGLTQRKARRL